MWFGSFEIAVLLPNEALRVERLKIGPASPQQARRVEAAVRHLVVPSITLPYYDCLAASRLARYSRSPNSTGLSASYLDSASEFSFDFAFVNLVATFTAPLAMK